MAGAGGVRRRRDAEGEEEVVVNKEWIEGFRRGVGQRGFFGRGKEDGGKEDGTRIGDGENTDQALIVTNLEGIRLVKDLPIRNCL